MEDLKTKVHEAISKIVEEGNILGNIDSLYKLVDIHKDISNEEYWKEKEENMKIRYGNYGENYRGEYGNYGRDEYGEGSYGRRMRDSRGRYKGEYGRRYRGEEMVEDMQDAYREYAEGREQYGRGNYGAKEDTMKGLRKMLESATDFVDMLKRDASSQEEAQMIQEYTRRMSEM